METALTLGGRGLPILTRVVAPYIAPQVFDTYRINMASAWNLVIVAELAQMVCQHLGPQLVLGAAVGQIGEALPAGIPELLGRCGANSAHPMPAGQPGGRELTKLPWKILVNQQDVHRQALGE